MCGEIPGRCFSTLFFLFEKTFFKVSAQNFRHHFTWYHWLRKFHIVFEPFIIQNYYVFSFCLNCAAISQSKSSNFFMCIIIDGRRGGLMVSALDSGLSPGRRHCVVFLGKTPMVNVDLQRVFRRIIHMRAAYITTIEKYISS